MPTDIDAALDEAWDRLYAKLERILPSQPAPAHQHEAAYAVMILKSAGAALQQASQSLQEAAEALKWAGKGKGANKAIIASRKAREAAQGLL